MAVLSTLQRINRRARNIGDLTSAWGTYPGERGGSELPWHSAISLPSDDPRAQHAPKEG